MPDAQEVLLYSLVGPTHHYGGLSYGNRPSMEHSQNISNPKAAALQSLKMMQNLHDLGINQVILPPHERPHIPTLRTLGFEGTDSQIIERSFKTAPAIFQMCSSASPMWAANAATVTPSSDSIDAKVHFTPANLLQNFHRSIETEMTATLLKKVFADPKHFVHHLPLPEGGGVFSDEGAANHTRLCHNHASSGVSFFVYDCSLSTSKETTPKRFPARQSLEAHLAISQQHRLSSERTVFAQQLPETIDLGAFHNDIVCVGNENVLFLHERAFLDTEGVLNILQKQVETFCNTELEIVQVSESEISLKEAIQTYLFNSQLVTLPSGAMALISPKECQENPRVNAYLNRFIEHPDTPIQVRHTFDLRQSMHNGGGPACLRMRVVLTSDELKAMHPHVLLTHALLTQLKEWVETHYREELSPNDLADPDLLQETRDALSALTHILHLGPLYSFQ